MQQCTASATTRKKIHRNYSGLHTRAWQMEHYMVLQPHALCTRLLLLLLLRFMRVCTGLGRG